MKYTITLNQNIMIEHRLNVPKMAILDVLSVAPSWCEAIIHDNEVFYWVSRSKIADELQAFEYKDDTIYRHLKELSELGFIDYEKQGKKDLIRLTQKGKSLFINSEKNPNYDENSENNPTKLGKKSEFNSEKNPTYKDTNIHKDTNDKQVAFSIPDFINIQTWDEWVQHRKEIKKKLTATTVNKQLAQLEAWHKEGHDVNKIIENAIAKGWTGLYLQSDNGKQKALVTTNTKKDYSGECTWA